MSFLNENELNLGVNSDFGLNRSREFITSSFSNIENFSKKNPYTIIIFIITLIVSVVFVVYGSRKNSVLLASGVFILAGVLMAGVFMLFMKKGNGMNVSRGLLSTLTGPQLVFLALLFLLIAGWIFMKIMSYIPKPNVSDYLQIQDKETSGSGIVRYLAGPGQAALGDMDGLKYGYVYNTDLKNDLSNQFTYSFWLNIAADNFKNENTTWSVVFVKGGVSGGGPTGIYRGKTPGVYLAPTVNRLIATIACANGTEEGNAIVIDDIPVNEWFAVSLVLEGRGFDCYINGKLERSIALTGAPQMNERDLYKGISGGFKGQIAFLRYNDSALTPETINKKYKIENNYMKKFLS